MIATRPASAPHYRKLPGAFSTPFRPFATANASSAAGVAIPIRVRFDDLEPEKRPASSDPSFANSWRETGDENGIIHQTVKGWRGYGK